MKCLITLMFFISTFCYSQSGDINYKVESLKKETNNKKLVKEINREYPLMSFRLKYNEYNSFFKQEKSIPVDPLKFRLASILIDSKESWFQNKAKKESVINIKIKGDKYQVVYEKMKQENWSLKEETKSIDGFTCYKAERKQLNRRTGNYVTITAWYTPDIPFPYGPIGEGGLPGVILQLQKGNLFVYTAKKVTLNSKKIKVDLPEKAEKINVTTLVKLMRKARKVTAD